MNIEWKDEVKIALIMDDYKLKNKEEWWQKALDAVPKLKSEYDFIREEICPGLTPNTVTSFRYFKRKVSLKDECI